MRVIGHSAYGVVSVLFRLEQALVTGADTRRQRQLIFALHKRYAHEDKQFRARIVDEVPASQMTDELLEVAVNCARCGPAEWLKSKPAAVSLELWLRIYELVPPEMRVIGAGSFSEYTHRLTRALFYSKRSPYVRTRDG